jgi:septal ring factor EnvC (AmiA/AmiB activator)
MTSLIQRVCKCGCNQVFSPPASRPRQDYKHGHKPRQTGPSIPGTPGQMARSLGRTDAERRTLDYRLALATAKREIEGITKQIDGIDDEIDELRKKLHSLEAEKEKQADRHLTIDTSIDILEALISGKSVRELVSAEASNG